MKKSFVIIILMLLSLSVFSQVEIDKEEKPPFKERIYFGGGFSATFGDITSVYVSPIVGYMITRGLSGGVGITYMYYKNNWYEPAYESHSYGYRLFLRQNLNFIPKLPLFAYGEHESLNFEAVQYNNNTGEYYLSRSWYPRLMLGLGIFTPFGRRGGFSFTVMYDVIYSGSTTSAYNSPWVYRIGLSF
jgi:hypothetical protein